MKNHSFSIVFSVVLLSLSGCSKEFYEGGESYPHKVSLSIAEARRYVESQLAGRTRSADYSESNTLMLGNYTTDWYRAQISVGDVLYSVDAPVASEYVYYLVGADSAGNRTLTPMYHKLIVVKDGESEALSSYIRFYLPDYVHARTHSRSYYDSLLNSNPKTRFTGMSVYTTLTGFPVAAGRYENSVLTKKEFLFDTLRPLEDNWVRLANLLDGVYVGRGELKIHHHKHDLLMIRSILKMLLYARCSRRPMKTSASNPKPAVAADCRRSIRMIPPVAEAGVQVTVTRTTNPPPTAILKIRRSKRIIRILSGF